MEYHFYVNFMKDRQVHAGVQMDKAVTFVRPPREQIRSTQIDAFIDIFLKTETPLTWSIIDQVIDEGLQEISPLNDDQTYSVETQNGKLGLLCDKGFPSTAKEIKGILRDQHKSICRSGTAIIKS
jgi:hypothetical protein